jgi:hypothetical protein
MKNIPSWYKLFLENRLKKLETALTYLDLAEKKLDSGFPFLAEIKLNQAKKLLKRENFYD